MASIKFESSLRPLVAEELAQLQPRRHKTHADFWWGRPDKPVKLFNSLFILIGDLFNSSNNGANKIVESRRRTIDFKVWLKAKFKVTYHLAEELVRLSTRRPKDTENQQLDK